MKSLLVAFFAFFLGSSALATDVGGPGQPYPMPYPIPAPYPYPEPFPGPGYPDPYPRPAPLPPLPPRPVPPSPPRACQNYTSCGECYLRNGSYESICTTVDCHGAVVSYSRKTCEAAPAPKPTPRT